MAQLWDRSTRPVVTPFAQAWALFWKADVLDGLEDTAMDVLDPGRADDGPAFLERKLLNVLQALV